MLQLPGGSKEGDESSEAAGRRELAQETGYTGGEWISQGVVYPLPGLTPAKVHLWLVRGAEEGRSHPESSERDLRYLTLPLHAARTAVFAGKVQCAASAALILRISSLT